jgi:AraC-like DNA-binding protein
MTPSRVLEHETPLCLPTAKDPLLRAVMDHTNANLATVTLADVCRTVGVSERTLRRAFPVATGMTWRQYLFESRLLRQENRPPATDAAWRHAMSDSRSTMTGNSVR